MPYPQLGRNVGLEGENKLEGESTDVMKSSRTAVYAR